MACKRGSPDNVAQEQIQKSDSAKLRSCGYKLTQQRRSVLSVFGQGSEHFTAQEVHDRLSAKEPDISLATVYRTLELLVEVGILRKLNFNDGSARYERNLGDNDHHHHLICTECGKVVEFRDCLMGPIELKLEEATDFRIEKHWLEVMGQCKECQAKKAIRDKH